MLNFHYFDSFQTILKKNLIIKNPYKWFLFNSEKLFVVNKYFSYNFYVFSFYNLGIAHCRKSPMFAISFILTYQDNKTLKIRANHTLCPLWLVYDIYLPSSETPPFSCQTVVAGQINAPTVCLKFQKLFCFLIKRIINQNNLK